MPRGDIERHERVVGAWKAFALVELALLAILLVFWGAGWPGRPEQGQDLEGDWYALGEHLAAQEIETLGELRVAVDEWILSEAAVGTEVVEELQVLDSEE